MKFFTSISSIVLTLGLAPYAFATGNLAVVDSGTDVQHQDLISKIWLNFDDSTVNQVDDDKNGYIDDINGWNFAENNNILVDRKYIGTFSQDCYKFFDVQGRLLLGIGTEEDKQWYTAKINDQEFIKELNKFGNFTHGTHVSGIGIKQSENVKVMGVKLIPTEQPGLSELRAKLEAEGTYDNNNDFLLLMILQYSADNNIKLMKKIAQYVQKEGMHVANCSFGSSEKMVRKLVRQQLESMGDTEITDERVNRIAKSFFTDMLLPRGKEAFGDPAPGVLWVYAAGNDGSNNSEFATFPANIRLENTITVAAAINYQALASFSNYSAELVDVAAPGVVIRSTIPGNEYLSMSGTSQAAPFVSNIATQVKAINERLSAAQVKDIILKTVDKKDWLTGKVKSGGIVNRDRALEAARMSRDVPLKVAITGSFQVVGSIEPMFKLPADTIAQDVFVLPLPSPFGFEN